MAWLALLLLLLPVCMPWQWLPASIHTSWQRERDH
jgi:hypothetical protein